MGNVHMEATQINYRGGSKKMSVEEAIKAAGTEITPEEKTWIDSIPALTTSNAGKTDNDVIAPEFDAEAGVYAVGDKVMYEGKLYEFTTAHETPGDWDSTEVSETTVADELSSLESGLINCQLYVSDCTIDNSTSAQDFDYPSGLNGNNAVLVAAKLYTQYNSWVDPTYNAGQYYGDFLYFGAGDNKFRYTPDTAGATTRILFYFRKV